MDRADGIPETMSDFQAPYDLDQFFGAYFHQDWPIEANNWQGIVDQYSASPNRSPQQLLVLADHIDELIARYPDPELPAVILNMGGFYDPRPELTYAEWLRRVADRLRQNAEAIDS